MLTRTPFTVVIVDHECPRLLAGLEALSNVGNCIRLRLGGVVVVVESNIHVATFVIHGLHMALQLGDAACRMRLTHSDHCNVCQIL